MSSLEDHIAEQDAITTKWGRRPKGAWVNDPEFPPEEWIDEVRLGHTRLGYEQWLEEAREASGALALNSYTISLAVTVSAYGTVTVQAESLAAALEKVRADAADASSGKSSIWDEVKEDGIDWCTQREYRVLSAVNGWDRSDAVSGIDLVTDLDDVISADHLAWQLEAKALNDTITPMTLEQRLDQTPDPDAEAFSKYVMFGK
jgi:hypothetical protein